MFHRYDYKLKLQRSGHVEGSAKEWSLGCVKRAPAAREGQDAGITQPRDHSLADPCMHLHYAQSMSEDEVFS